MKKSKILILCLLMLIILGLLTVAIVLLAGGETAEPEQTPDETQAHEISKPVPEDPVLTDRRKIAEAEMRRTMSMPIVYETDFSYPFMGGTRQMNLKADQVYQGLPYTNGSGCADAMLRNATVDEDGTYHVTDFDGYLMGNDCADAVFWSWARVSNTITFRDTQEMTEDKGVLKVGEYENPDAVNERTKQICQQNGEQVMYAAYAQTRLADALVHRNDGAGHAVMVAEASVSYADDGTIDGNESYVIYHEQSIPCAVDQKLSFKMLYLQGYLPVTIREFVDVNEPVETAAVTDSVTQPDVDTMLTGTITANYRMSDVYVEIKNTDGEAVQSARRYVNEEEMYTFSMEHFLFHTHLWNYSFTENVYQDFIELTALEQGSYTCTVTVLLSTGESVTVRDFAFEV